MIAKRALKRELGYPVGIPAPLYLDCECGHHLSMPVVKGLPFAAYVCLCGREYDSRGWIVNTCLCGAPMQGGVCSVKGCVCSK